MLSMLQEKLRVEYLVYNGPPSNSPSGFFLLTYHSHALKIDPLCLFLTRNGLRKSFYDKD